MKIAVLLALLMSPLSLADEIVLMSINTEWFWDELPPHEGNIAIGAIGRPPSSEYVDLKAWAIAHMIEDAGADVVALTEIESDDVVQRIADFLGPDWEIAFDKGRDGITGQDVAMITPHDIDTASISDLPNAFGNGATLTNVRASKVLGVEIEIDGDDFLFVAAHLISKRTAGNDDKRLGQADGIRLEILGRFSTVDHIVIMGDLNDTPGSPPLNRIRGLDDSQPDFIQTGRVGGPDPSFSFTFQGVDQLIDHILLSPSLQSAFDAIATDDQHVSIDTGPLSDHRAWW